MFRNKLETSAVKLLKQQQQQQHPLTCLWNV